MSVTLPEALLLFALHDDKGTVHPIAFMAVDHGLRGAVLAELRLRGYLQTRSDGLVRHRPDAPEAPSHPALANALRSLRGGPPATVQHWLQDLAAGVPHLRSELITTLRRRRVLSSADRELMGLPTAITHPAVESVTEDSLGVTLRTALDAGEAISPRQGTLLALVVACHLEKIVLGDRAADALPRAAWVAERDAVVREVQRLINDAEGLA